MHIKETPGCSYDHLRNAIDYILDVKNKEAKTAGGTLVGGNCGLDHQEILENFLETKREYGKTDGRQGYHFVISFAKGETDAVTAYKVIQEFCREYLGDNYDYVFAIHKDKEHMHGHIIFNSVSRTTGYKYHYKKGDWEKSIQPVTDSICHKYGLSPLEFANERVGMSYASWAAVNGGKCNWTNIIRADVDYAIQKASSADEFLSLMKKMNYTLEMGKSRKTGEDYITFIFHTPDGETHRRRSNNKKLMPKGYSPKEILERIQTKEGSRSYEDIVKKLSGQASDYLKKPVMFKSDKIYSRLYQAVSYYNLPNPFAVPAYRVRKDMLHLDRLLEECRYLKEYQVKSVQEVKLRIDTLDKRLEKLLSERKQLYKLCDSMNPQQQENMKYFEQLQEKVIEAGDADSRFEALEDEMEKLTNKYPVGILETGKRIEELKKQISDIRKEKRILNRIWETEQEGLQKEKEIKM